jgi:hypothetical protein
MGEIHLHQQFLSSPPEIEGRSRNAAIGSPLMILSETRDRDGENEPILQNAVCENIGEYNKVIYVIKCKHGRGMHDVRTGSGCPSVKPISDALSHTMSATIQARGGLLWTNQFLGWFAPQRIKA